MAQSLREVPLIHPDQPAERSQRLAVVPMFLRCFFWGGALSVETSGEARGELHGWSKPEAAIGGFKKGKGVGLTRNASVRRAGDTHRIDRPAISRMHIWDSTRVPNSCDFFFMRSMQKICCRQCLQKQEQGQPVHVDATSVGRRLGLRYSGHCGKLSP